jgi:hypothetical protein
MHQSSATQAGAYLQQIESHRRLVTEGRERLQAAELQVAELTDQCDRARSLAVELENELAQLTEAHDNTLAALYAAGVELCECRDTYPKHVQGVPGCRFPHSVHEYARAAA